MAAKDDVQDGPYVTAGRGSTSQLHVGGKPNRRRYMRGGPHPPLGWQNCVVATGGRCLSVQDCRYPH